jgi:RNA-directed DNA polymerase
MPQGMLGRRSTRADCRVGSIRLRRFEKAFHRDDGPAHWAKARIVRYADDFVALAHGMGPQLIEWIESQLEGRFRLTINRTKTQVVKLHESGTSLDFLGFTLRYDRDQHGRDQRDLNVVPSEKSLAKLRDKLRELTGTKWGWKPIADLHRFETVQELNQYLQGWSQYFGHGYPSRAFHKVNKWVYDRLRHHLHRLRQRHFHHPEDQSVYESLQTLGLQLLKRKRPPSPVHAPR